MKLKDEIKKAQKALDDMDRKDLPKIPPQISGKEPQKIVVHVPQSTVQIMYQELPLTLVDMLAFIGMGIGILMLGMSIK